MLLQAIGSITAPFDLGRSEGVAFPPAMALAAGEPIFGPSAALTPPYLFAAYGLLFYAGIAGLFRAFGPGFGPARALSAVSGLAIAGTIYRAGRERGARPVAAWVGACLFLTLPAVSRWLGILRPDLVGALFAFGALLQVAPERITVRRGAAGGALALAALLVKPSLVAGPATAVLWLAARREWKGLAAFVATAGLGAAALAAVLDPGTGIDLLYTLRVHAGAPYRPGHALALILVNVSRPSWWAAVVCASFAVADRSERRRLPLLYLAFSVALNAITAGRVGASVNHFTESTVALAWVAALGLEVALRGGERQKGVAVGLVASLLLLDVAAEGRPQLLAQRRHASAMSTWQPCMVDEIARRVPPADPIATQYPTVAYDAARPLWFSDLWMYLSGPPDVRDALRRRLRDGRVAALLLFHPLEIEGYVPVRTACPERVGNERPVLYVPRATDSPL